MIVFNAGKCNSCFQVYKRIKDILIFNTLGQCGPRSERAAWLHIMHTASLSMFQIFLTNTSKVAEKLNKTINRRTDGIQ